MISELRKIIEEKIETLASQHLQMIEADKPKNQFSLMAGKLLAYRDIQDEISSLEQKARTPQEQPGMEK